MVITWYGQACFKIQSGERIFVIDPFSKSIGLAPPNTQADVVFVTHDHYDHNNVGALKGEPFIVNGPGEYDIKGAKIWGISSFHDEEGGAKRGLNTLYLIELEGIRILHLGDLGQKSLDDRQLEAIGNVDILMVPVGGNYTIDFRAAADIIKSLEPKIAIPMHYKIPKLTIQLAGVDKFLKEFADSDAKPQDKLTIKAKDFSIESEGTEIVPLKI